MTQEFEINMSIEQENPMIMKIKEVCKRMADNKKSLKEANQELKQELFQVDAYTSLNDEVTEKKNEMKRIKAELLDSMPQLRDLLEEYKAEISADKILLNDLVIHAIEKQIISPNQALEIGGGFALAPKMSVSYNVQQMDLGL